MTKSTLSRTRNTKYRKTAILKSAFIFFSVAVFIGILAFSASADEEISMYASLAELTEMPENRTVIDPLTTATSWTSPDKSASIASEGTAKISITPFESAGDFGGILPVAASRAEEIRSMTDICLNVRLTSSDQDHKIRLTLNTDESSITYSAVIPSGEIYSLYAPLDRLAGGETLKSIEIRVSDNDSQCTRFELLDLFAYSDHNASNAERYSFSSFSALEGGMARAEGSIALIAGKSDSAAVYGIAAYNDYSVSGDIIGYSFDITVYQNAVMSLFADYGSGEIEVSTLNLSPATRNYYFILPQAHPRAVRISIKFEEPNGEAIVSSVKYMQDGISSEIFEYDSVARITELQYDSTNEKLVINGTLPSDTVIEHINAEIGLFAFHINESEYKFDAEHLIVKSKISTKFDFSIDASILPRDFAICRYTLVILDHTDIIPISDLMFPDLPSGNSSFYGSKIALHGGSPTNAFEANAANVIVDISLPLLVGGDELYRTGTLVTHGTKYYYLNKKYLNELETQMKLYDALGISVYFRLLIDQDMSSDKTGSLSYGGTENAKMYAVNIDDPDGENLFLACVEYISREFSSVKGFILGSAIDSRELNYLFDGATLSQIAENHAKTLAMLYKTAVLYAPNISVYTPISDESSSSCHAVALVSSALERYGDIAWSLLIESSYYDEKIADRSELISEQISMIAPTSPYNIAVLWQVSKTADDKLSDIYSSACTSNDSPLVSAYFISLESTSYSAGLYDRLKYIILDDSRITESYSAVADIPDFNGKYTIWDFRSEYSTLGWLNGGGCASLNSQRAEDGLRCLSAKLICNANGGFDGMVLCTLPDNYSLSYSPVVAIEFSISGLTDSAELTLTFGDGERRAEYTATVTAGSRMTLYCDLSKYSAIHSIEYVAARVAGYGEDVKMDIYSVSVASRSLNDNELANKFSGSSSDQLTSEHKKTANSAIVAFCVVVLALTGVVFALLSKNKFDNNSSSANENNRKKVN